MVALRTTPTFSTWPMTSRHFLAANPPMDTWSSWLHDVGMLSTDDGWHSTLFSDTAQGIMGE